MQNPSGSASSSMASVIWVRRARHPFTTAQVSAGSDAGYACFRGKSAGACSLVLLCWAPGAFPMALSVRQWTSGATIVLGALSIAGAACHRQPQDHQRASADPNPDDYRPMCDAALAAAEEFTRRL